MLYVNSYLDRFAEALKGNLDALKEMLDPENLPGMFERDCKEVIELLRSGRAEREEAKRALRMLKSYVVSQLMLHFERAKEFAKSKGLEVRSNLDPALVNEIALMIDRFEKEL